jgi:DNA-binding MarR family transcriptional regulator
MLSNTPLPCLCASFRRAARALTQVYDDALRPQGLRATQFTILQALSLTGEISQGDLGELLALDSTTLTRTLRLMRARGWIEERPGKDRRERWLQLSVAGRRQFKRASVPWQELQTQLRSRVGSPSWQEWLAAATEISRQISAAKTRDPGPKPVPNPVQT